MGHNVAVIGSGYWGRNLVRNFYELGVLACVCDRSPESLKNIKNQFSEVAVNSSFEQVETGVKTAKPGSDHVSFVSFRFFFI